MLKITHKPTYFIFMLILHLVIMIIHYIIQPKRVRRQVVEQIADLPELHTDSSDSDSDGDADDLD